MKEEFLNLPSDAKRDGWWWCHILEAWVERMENIFESKLMFINKESS
jgi:hypothetical protein